MADAETDALPLSAILRGLSALDGEIPISVFVDRFGARAFGALLFVFAVACALPLPPGSSTLLGAPLVLLAPQVALGAKTPWLPRGLRGRTIRAEHLRHACERLLPVLERIEKVSRPRLGFLFGPVGERLMGAVCTLLALVLILPIPLGNVLPAAAVAGFSLALVQRDGALALAGYALTAASTAVLALAAHVVIGAARHLVSMIGGA
ncbi:exopolysaccharide biosynthesis protein [Phenylobacterium sp.]|jgi:hypothetical protein|uniref:exopolysaccharide biosynthesis protein n=1 Tax=Phenylobacterium sp. TaxID=1871053 RepID=UPI002F429737